MCSNETSYFDSDEFYLTTLHILTVIEVPVHLFGAFIVIFKTPKKMASIKNSLLSLHCLSAFVDFYLSFLTSPVLSIPSSAGYPLGISKCTWVLSPVSAATSMSVVMAAAHGVMSTITMLIVHRPYREATLDTFYWMTLKERKPAESRIVITVVGQNGQIAKRVAS
ncbi:hypothetical protein B9Z55_019361 [Caenorhabditis nigoni]|uniref:G-protein coupled receptors family 1 profile domain-containing protein n=1 Tax=Caenorhabditis nigoni TaxID=1611254 RepID=A0A2G5TIV9_9PELO|nr:hypothetical protein B9Z55_019361 [Caenorhabditis nigoni]